MENMQTGGPEGWVLFQVDDPNYQVLDENERVKASAEEWLAAMDEGSDAEDCPHRLEPAPGGGPYVYLILTANGESCCNVRDIAMTYHSPVGFAPNRWVAVDPKATFLGAEFAYMGSIIRNYRRDYKAAHDVDLNLSDWEVACVVRDAGCAPSASEQDEWIVDDLHEAALRKAGKVPPSSDDDPKVIKFPGVQ